MIGILELLDAGLCTSSCLLALPDQSCDCRCRNQFHGSLVNYFNEYGQGVGWRDLRIVYRGRTARIEDEPVQVGWSA